MAIDLMSAGGAVLDTTTAGAEWILHGLTAYDGNGNLITGTMPHITPEPELLMAGSTYIIPRGYHTGKGSIRAMEKINIKPTSERTTAIASDIIKDTTVNSGDTYTISGGYNDGNGKATANRTYTTVLLGQQTAYWTGFSYDVKSHYPSIYSRLSRSNFYAEPYKYTANNDPNGSYVNQGDCSDFVSYDSSTGVVTMNGFGVGVQGQMCVAILFKLYMVY
mgnify:CR=1 FL=1